MERINELREYLKPYIVSRLHEKIENVSGMRDDGLVSSAESLLHAALRLQSLQPQWRPAYMGLFHLMSSLVTGSCKYELVIADQQMYLDQLQVAGIWKPKFLYQNEQEKTAVTNNLKKRFIRLNRYETTYAKRLVFYEYRNIAGVYWKDHLKEITELDDFKKLEKGRPFRFLFGDYMGETHTVLNYEEVLQNGK